VQCALLFCNRRRAGPKKNKAVGHDGANGFAFPNACRVRGAVEYHIRPTDGLLERKDNGSAGGFKWMPRVRCSSAHIVVSGQHIARQSHDFALISKVGSPLPLSC
jgi:hypothetical protein